MNLRRYFLGWLVDVPVFVLVIIYLLFNHLSSLSFELIHQ
jgi:hypothetical protein